MGTGVGVADDGGSAVDAGVPKVGVRAGPVGVTALLAEDAALVPALLVAVTVKVYAVPLVRPVTVQVSVEPSPVVQDLVLSSTAVTV